MELGRGLRGVRKWIEARLRPKVLLALGLIVALASLLLWRAFGLSDYTRNLAMNLGADLIGALVVIFVISPLITRAQHGRVREHRRPGGTIGRWSRSSRSGACRGTVPNWRSSPAHRSGPSSGNGLTTSGFTGPRSAASSRWRSRSPAAAGPDESPAGRGCARGPDPLGGQRDPGPLEPPSAGQIELNEPVLDGRRIRGLQHKYAQTLLVFPRPGQTCHAYCQYCFRWPQFVGEPDLKIATSDTESVIRYLHAHPEISDVLFTGGERDTGPQNFFAVPLERAHQIFRDAYAQVGGLERTVRGPVMSATAGKVCIDGIATVAHERVFVLRYLQARDPGLVGRPFFAHADPAAIWLTDLKPALGATELRPAASPTGWSATERPMWDPSTA